MTNSFATQAYIQGFKLVIPIVSAIYDLLECVK